MPFFLDTRETEQRFGSAVVEFRSLLDSNHIRHGSPNDLFAFTKTLEESNQFRTDLSVLVKSVVSRERDELLLTDMMSIIAAAVGGLSVADTTADITKPTNTLMEFLLGTGCWSWKHFGSTFRSMAQRVASTSVRVEEPEPIRIALPVTRATSTTEVPEDKASLLEISRELRQTLSRLESNTQQVKLHLDSIEQRIGRLETASETPSVNKLEGLEPLLHRGGADIVPPKIVSPPVREIPVIEPPLPTRGSAIFSGSVFHDESSADDEDDFSSPTFAYGTEKRRSIVPIALFIILVAIGTAIFFFVHSARGHALLQAGLGRIEANRSHLSSSAVPAPSASVTTSATPSSATTLTPNAGSSTAADAPSATPPPTDQHSTAGIAETTSQPSASASEGAGAGGSSGSQTLSDGTKIRYVPANVMEGYLLSAPRPEYPAQARIEHIEGQVVLQAVISRSGAIRTLHAIKGPASLRSAAVDAVRNWRYKPYSVDGQTQDVATTVYVDFNLRPPPALVH